MRLLSPRIHALGHLATRTTPYTGELRVLHDRGVVTAVRLLPDSTAREVDVTGDPSAAKTKANRVDIMRVKIRGSLPSLSAASGGFGHTISTSDRPQSLDGIADASGARRTRLAALPAPGVCVDEIG